MIILHRQKIIGCMICPLQHDIRQLQTYGRTHINNLFWELRLIILMIIGSTERSHWDLSLFQHSIRVRKWLILCYDFYNNFLLVLDHWLLRPIMRDPMEPCAYILAHYYSKTSTSLGIIKKVLFVVWLIVTVLASTGHSILQGWSADLHIQDRGAHSTLFIYIIHSIYLPRNS